MALPCHSLHGNRPAYLDKLFHETPPSPPPMGSPRARSTKSSISSLNSELHTNEGSARQLSPGFEADSFDDRISVRSLRLHLSPRFKIRNILNRRTYPHIQETPEFDSTEGSSSGSLSPSMLSSLPRPQTASSSLPRKRHQSKSKALPSMPSPKIEQLHCTPCYYFAARNCNGHVLGGGHGDACENCAVRLHGIFRQVQMLMFHTGSRFLWCTLIAQIVAHVKCVL